MKEKESVMIRFKARKNLDGTERKMQRDLKNFSLE